MKAKLGTDFYSIIVSVSSKVEAFEKADKMFLTRVVINREIYYKVRDKWVYVGDVLPSSRAGLMG